MFSLSRNQSSNQLIAFLALQDSILNLILDLQYSMHATVVSRIEVRVKDQDW